LSTLARFSARGLIFRVPVRANFETDLLRKPVVRTQIGTPTGESRNMTGVSRPSDFMCMKQQHQKDVSRRGA
jgi:hypothetical protein